MFLNHFDVQISEIIFLKKYFNIFINKKYFENQPNLKYPLVSPVVQMKSQFVAVVFQYNFYLNKYIFDIYIKANDTLHRENNCFKNNQAKTNGALKISGWLVGSRDGKKRCPCHKTTCQAH